MLQLTHLRDPFVADPIRTRPERVGSQMFRNDQSTVYHCSSTWPATAQIHRTRITSRQARVSTWGSEGIGTLIPFQEAIEVRIIGLLPLLLLLRASRQWLALSRLLIGPTRPIRLIVVPHKNQRFCRQIRRVQNTLRQDMIRLLLHIRWLNALRAFPQLHPGLAQLQSSPNPTPT